MVGCSRSVSIDVFLLNAVRPSPSMINGFFISVTNFIIRDCVSSCKDKPGPMITISTFSDHCTSSSKAAKLIVPASVSF